MDFSKYNLTPTAQSAIKKAQTIANELNHLKTVDLHLLIAILQEENVNIEFSLEKVDVIHSALLEAVISVTQMYKEPKRKKVIYAPEIREIVEHAHVIAHLNDHDYVGVDHIFLSILETREEIIEFFKSLEIDVDSLTELMANALIEGVRANSTESNQQSAAKTSSQTQQKETNHLDKCCTNLNHQAIEKGSFDIFGRDKEIDRAFEILLRKNKSNVIFVGEAGVGKTAIVEGMAEKIVQRECPDLLLHKEILTLDVTSLVSGTIYRGQMEEKIRDILKSVEESKKYILFIDEIHTIIGSGSSEGSLDLANILKPALSRGNISCIGATTQDEYKRFFERDGALNRRFEHVTVLEPTIEETKALISKAKTSYEKYHQVKYTDELVDLIVDLCDKYQPNQKFPDKAFDVLDESGAKTKKKHLVRPNEAKELEKTLMDPEFQQSEEYEAEWKKYETILKDWGKELENWFFEVDKETIYDIFASKLNTTSEKVKSCERVYIRNKIGF